MNKSTYVCNDRSIRIEAEDLPGARRIVITLSVNSKQAWQFMYRNPLDRNDKISERLDHHTTAACEKISLMSKRQIEDYVDPDKIMISLYIWQHLKEVRTKIGNVIWAKS